MTHKPGRHTRHHPPPPPTPLPRRSKETAPDRYQQKSTHLTQESEDKCAISKSLLHSIPARATSLASHPLRPLNRLQTTSTSSNSSKPQEPPVERHSAAARLQGDARARLKTVSKASCGCSFMKTVWMIMTMIMPMKRKMMMMMMMMMMMRMMMMVAMMLMFILERPKPL